LPPLVPLRLQWYGLATVLLANDPELLEELADAADAKVS